MARKPCDHCGKPTSGILGEGRAPRHCMRCRDLWVSTATAPDSDFRFYCQCAEQIDDGTLCATCGWPAWDSLSPRVQAAYASTGDAPDVG